MHIVPARRQRAIHGGPTKPATSATSMQPRVNRALWRRRGVHGRAPGLHDAGSAASGDRRRSHCEPFADDSARAGHQRAASGCARGDRAAHRVRPCDRGRARLYRKPVQSRRRRAAAAGLGIQAVHLRDGTRVRASCPAHSSTGSTSQSRPRRGRGFRLANTSSRPSVCAKRSRCRVIAPPLTCCRTSGCAARWIWCRASASHRRCRWCPRSRSGPAR